MVDRYIRLICCVCVRCMLVVNMNLDNVVLYIFGDGRLI